MARTLAIGLDGCSWNVLEPLLASGRLPNLRRLVDEGAAGSLESTIPFYTGPAWASFATGTSPGAHGIYDFTMLREGGRLSPASLGDLRRTTYYELLARDGKRSVLVNLPLDQEAPDGSLVVNSWLTPDEERRIFPLDRRGRYAHALAAYTSYPTTWDAPLDVQLAELREIEASRFELAKALLEGEDWDHFFVLFSSTDWIGHAATGSFLSGDEGARSALLELYGELDGYVGWLVEHAPGATVALLSDHGQCEETHVVHVNAVLRDLGLVKLVRERAASRPASAGLPRTLNVPPALTGLRRNRVLRSAARRATGWVRDRLGVDVVTPLRGSDADRATSRAFMPTVASYAVHARDCTDEELAAIAERLLELRLDDGRPAFDGVWTFEELYGRPRLPGAPALVFAPAAGVRPSIHVRTPVVDRAPRRGRGAHQREGILVLAGDEIAPARLERASICDLAPTILWAMESPVPAEADGRVLFEAFREDVRDGREYRETDDVHEQRAAVDAGRDSGEVERRLRDLGYL